MERKRKDSGRQAGAQTRPCSGAPDSLKSMAEEGGNVVFVGGGREAPNVNSSSMTRGLLRGRGDPRHQACNGKRRSAHVYCNYVDSFRKCKARRTKAVSESKQDEILAKIRKRMALHEEPSADFWQYTHFTKSSFIRLSTWKTFLLSKTCLCPCSTTPRMLIDGAQLRAPTPRYPLQHHRSRNENCSS